MPKVRIYQPDKNPMQSGKGKTRRWLLEFEPATPYFIDPLMGWSGTRDMPREMLLFFPTQEEAVAYAQKNNLEYQVFEPPVRKQLRKAYADNFKYVKTS